MVYTANWGMDYATYHLLGEPETTIESCGIRSSQFSGWMRWFDEPSGEMQSIAMESWKSNGFLFKSLGVNPHQLDDSSGQIITTSAEVTLNFGLVREFPPPNPLNSGLGIILICQIVEMLLRMFFIDEWVLRDSGYQPDTWIGSPGLFYPYKWVICPQILGL